MLVSGHQERPPMTRFSYELSVHHATKGLIKSWPWNRWEICPCSPEACRHTLERYKKKDTQKMFSTANTHTYRERGRCVWMWWQSVHHYILMSWGKTVCDRCFQYTSRCFYKCACIVWRTCQCFKLYSMCYTSKYINPSLSLKLPCLPILMDKWSDTNSCKIKVAHLKKYHVNISSVKSLWSLVKRHKMKCQMSNENCKELS